MDSVKLNKFMDKEGYIDLLKICRRNFKKFSLEEAKILLEEDNYKLKLSGGALSMLLCSFDIGPEILATCVELMFLSNLYLDSRVPRYDIENIIKSSDMYIECNELYNKYLLDLGEFFKSIDIKDSIKIATFFTKMLNDGFLSVNNHHEYKRFIYDFDMKVPELLGSRVMTGYSVCRNNACMLTDLLNIMGYNSCNLIVKHASKIYYQLPFLIKINILYNHLITGIIDNEKKYAFDPTDSYGAGKMVTFDLDYEKKHRIKANSFAFSRTELLGKIFYEHGYLVEKLFDEKYSLKYFRNFEKFKETSPIDMSLIDSEKNIIEFLNHCEIYYKKEILEFYKEHLEMVKRIAELNNYITPHSNKLIKEWKIR